MKRIFTLLLITAMMLTLLASCKPETDKNLEINVSVLSGTTGMGIAPLIKDTNDGKATLNYKFDIQSDATLIAPGILNKSVDIAAVPTNLAATLYNKTNGGIKILAANTKGVLYVLSKDTSVTSIADLKGKTVHVPGQGTNPEFLLRHVLTANSLEIGKDVNIDYTYNSPDALTAALTTTGDVSFALLPEPKVSAVQAKDPEVKAVINLTTEWNKISNGSELYQGCVIVRTEFLEEHPNEVAEFLKAYEASVNSVIADPETASAKIAEVGIIPNANLAKKAIPNCNLCFDTSKEMQKSVMSLFEILHALQPTSVGGKIPGEDIFAN